MAEPTSERIDCRKCRHFRITWEKSRPYACDSFGFKSLVLPNIEVRKSSGEDCKLFVKKNP